MTRLHLFRLNARELLREPGLDKHVSVELPAAELGVADDRITGDLTVDLHAVSTIDGITVRGTVAVTSMAVRRDRVLERSFAMAARSLPLPPASYRQADVSCWESAA